MIVDATMPPAWSGPSGHVNISPQRRGRGTFAIRDGHRVAYLDYHGSGAETIAHLQENARITPMFCAFQGAPSIVRGAGRPPAGA